MKPPGKVSRWIELMGLVSGITIIIGFFVELLAFDRWRPMLALSGTGFTVVFAYRLIEHHHLRKAMSDTRFN